MILVCSLANDNFSIQEFNRILQEKAHEVDIEIHFKDTFRAFSKDEDGKFNILNQF